MTFALIALSVSIVALCISHLLLSRQVSRNEQVLGAVCMLLTDPEVRDRITIEMREKP